MPAEAKINKTTLDNGVRILTKQMPHVRSVSMGVWVNAGARDETLDESGISHFIEHMIFKGTKTRSAYKIAKEFDAIGGQTNAFTSMENTCYHAKVMDTHLETMVDILSDIFLNSEFDPLEIEKERPVIFQEIGMVEDSPEEHVHLLSGKAFWGDHPLGRSVLGPRDNILRFDNETMRAFFLRLYQPDRIIVSAAGNLDHNRFVDLVAPAFEVVVPQDGFPDRTPPKEQPKILIAEKPLEQTHICIATRGLPIADPDRYAFSLANTLIGGNMSSKLFQEIRERKSLAYSVYSFISSHSDTGMFGAYTGVEPKNATASVALILHEMRKLIEAPVDPEDLRDAKEFTKASLLLAAESVDNQMVRLAQNDFHFEQYIALEDVVRQIEAVNSEDIQRLGNTLFQNEYLALAAVGPAVDKTLFEATLHF